MIFQVKYKFTWIVKFRVLKLLIRLYVQFFLTLRLQKALSYRVLKLLLRLKLLLLSYQKLLDIIISKNIDHKMNFWSELWMVLKESVHWRDKKRVKNKRILLKKPPNEPLGMLVMICLRRDTFSVIKPIQFMNVK